MDSEAEACTVKLLSEQDLMLSVPATLKAHTTTDRRCGSQGLHQAVPFQRVLCEVASARLVVACCSQGEVRGRKAVSASIPSRLATDFLLECEAVQASRA